MVSEFLARLPDPDLVRTLLERYVRARLEAKKDHLAEGDRAALPKLVDAARSIDRIYWRQRSEIGGDLIRALGNSAEHAGGELDRLLRLNFGPWDSLNGDSPFWGENALPPGGNFYPGNLDRNELNEYLSRHPEQREALLDATTLVRRRGDRLIAVPYAEAYAEELKKVESALREASVTVTSEALRRYLVARAAGLRSGDLLESEKLWIEASQSPIDIVIGPYEVYDDALKGVKTSYEAAVLVRHPLSSQIEDFERQAFELGRELPGAVAEDPSERNVRVGVYDVEYAAGMLNMGSKAIAVTLPNDERVRKEAGTRLLLFRNVIEAKFDSILLPLAERILVGEDLALVKKEAFLLQTLLHETGHALSAGYVESDRGQRNLTIKQALSERYSTIEECRADLLGLYFLGRLTRQGLLPENLDAPAATTFVAHSIRAVRFGDRSDHARAAAIILSHLCRSEAIRCEGDRLRIEPAKTQHTVQDLVAQVQSIANGGNYEAAGRLIDEHGKTPEVITALLKNTEDVPVDIEFIFAENG